MSYLDERIEPGNPLRVFQRLWDRLDMEPLKRLHEDDDRDGYIRLRKVVSFLQIPLYTLVAGDRDAG